MLTWTDLKLPPINLWNYPAWVVPSFNKELENKMLVVHKTSYTVKDLIEVLQQENPEALVSVYSARLNIDALVYKTVSHADKSEVCLYISNKGEQDA